MKRILNDPLLTAGRVIIYLSMGTLALAGLALFAALTVVIFSPDTILNEIAPKVPIEPGATEAWFFAGSFSMIIVLMTLLFLFLHNMLRIVNSVAEGDPFVPVNAKRLSAMAWLMLAGQIIAIPTAGVVVALTNRLGEDPGTVDVSFDLSGILMVVTLFILARVFRHGAAMREDLEGTV